MARRLLQRARRVIGRARRNRVVPRARRSAAPAALPPRPPARHRRLSAGRGACAACICAKAGSGTSPVPRETASRRLMNPPLKVSICIMWPHAPRHAPRFLRGLLAVRDTVPRPRRWVSGAAGDATRRSADAARAFRGDAPRRRRVAPDDKVVIWSENRAEWIVAFWGCLLARRRASCRWTTARRPICSRASAQIVKREVVLVGDEVTPPAGVTGEVWKLRGRRSGSRLPSAQDAARARRGASTADGPRPDGQRLVARRDHLHVRRDGRSEGRDDHASQRPREHHPDRAGDREVPEVRAAVSSDSLPEPAAAQPHVRPVDGDVRAADARRHGGLLARLQPGRDPSADQVAARLGARLRAEGARCPARARRARRAARRPSPTRSRASTGRWRWWHYRDVHRLFGWKFWCVVCGAAPLDPELEAFWRKLGFLVVQGYGLTETAPIVTLNHPLRASKGTVGTPIGGVEVQIADDGEILVRGDNVTSGYYVPEARRAAAAAASRAFRGRLVPHRRHRRAGRGRPAADQGPQERNDRHAAGTERLSRRRRARARRATRREGRRRRRPRTSTARSASTRCWCSSRARTCDAIVRGANARSKITSASGARRSGRARRCRARKARRSSSGARFSAGRRAQAAPAERPRAAGHDRRGRRQPLCGRPRADADTTLDELG